jgi:hypothetical protein
MVVGCAQPLGEVHLLTIRGDQLRVLSLSVLERFKQDLLRHLAWFAPELHALRGDQAFRQVIDDGVAHAARYGFTNRGPLRFFLECMFAYGTEFDRDLQIPDVRERLTEPHANGQLWRAEQVFDAIRGYHLSTRGATNEFAIAALRRLGPFMDRLDTLQDDTLKSDLLDLMERIHPEKHKYVGRVRLTKLIAIAREEATGFHMATPAGVGLLCGLMFALGTGVARDPLYPWVRDTLTTPPVQEAARRIERLRRKTRMYLNATLNNLST